MITVTLYCAIICCVFTVLQDCNGPCGLTRAGMHCTAPTLVMMGSGIKIVSGADHLIILTSSHDIYTMGRAEQGQLGRVAQMFSCRGGRRGMPYLLKPSKVHFAKPRCAPRPKFVDIYSGPYTTFGTTEDGALYVWGLNNYGQLSTGDMKDRYNPERLSGPWKETEDGDPVDIAGGEHHTLLCHKGSVFVCGRKDYGRLGLGQDQPEPLRFVKLPEMTGMVEVAAGSSCSFSMGKLGEVFSWGMGYSLQLGNGTDDDVWTPTKLCGRQLEGRRVHGMSAGGQHTALLVGLQTVRDQCS